MLPLVFLSESMCLNKHQRGRQTGLSLYWLQWHGGLCLPWAQMIAWLIKWELYEDAVSTVNTNDRNLQTSHAMNTVHTYRKRSLAQIENIPPSLLIRVINFELDTWKLSEDLKPTSRIAFVLRYLPNSNRTDGSDKRRLCPVEYRKVAINAMIPL